MQGWWLDIQRHQGDVVKALVQRWPVTIYDMPATGCEWSLDLGFFVRGLHCAHEAV